MQKGIELFSVGPETLSYLDDITIGAVPQQLNDLFPCIRAERQSVGLELNMQKTIAWIPDPRNVDITELSHIKPLLDNNAQPDGIVMCGQPLSKYTVEEEFRPNQTLPVGHRGFIVKYLDK